MPLMQIGPSPTLLAALSQMQQSRGVQPATRATTPQPAAAPAQPEQRAEVGPQRRASPLGQNIDIRC